jgi:hypothetical protein
VGIVCDAVDAAVAARLVELGVEAHLGEQILNEGFELLGGELKQVGPLVDIRNDIDRIDGARVGHAVGHHWLDGDQLVGMWREMSAKKYLRRHSTGLNRGSSMTSGANFSPVARKVMR